MSHKPDVSETRRSQILKATMKVFSRQGFHEARMDDIVQEAGLSKGALYCYFKSKDEVILANLDSLFVRQLSGLKGLQDVGIRSRTDGSGTAVETVIAQSFHDTETRLSFRKRIDRGSASSSNHQ